jgi:GxxExxY protein
MLTNPAGVNNLTRTTIGSAIRVHQHYGPGLVESVYDEAFTYELRDQGLEVATRVSLPLVYRGRKLSARFEIDLLVAGMLIVEVKSVNALAPIHTAQLLTYLKLTNLPVGLLINFNVPVLKDGVKRVVLAGRADHRPPEGNLA